ncbi:MAG: M73 family metallopeptidase [Clostridiales bacterium]|nr:M73 family metallopeptidase [Clostridiales bacterium]MCF8022574.1 M73 family metallopeptidase [Clostridiales bacterium]
MIKKKFFLALTIVLCTVGLVAGGTFALFTDSTSPADANFTAGTLVITNERDAGDIVPGPMFYVTAAQGATPDDDDGIYPTGVWAPGDSHMRTLTVYNHTPSTMDAWLVSSEASIESGNAAMADKLWVEVFHPETSGGVMTDVKVAEGALSTFLTGPVSFSKNLPCMLGGNNQLHFKVTFDKSAGNNLQGETLKVAFKVNAEQMKNNP